VLRSQQVGPQIGDTPVNKGVAGQVEEGMRHRWETAMRKEGRGREGGKGEYRKGRGINT